jgi:hypothetical protein
MPAADVALLIDQEAALVLYLIEQQNIGYAIAKEIVDSDGACSSRRLLRSKPRHVRRRWELVFRDTYSPYVPARCHDDALHQSELAVEGNTFRR